MAHLIPTRRPIRFIVAVVAFGMLCFLVATSPGAAAARASGCHPKRRQVIARRGSAVVFRRVTGPGGEYGAPSVLLGCLTVRQRPVRLAQFSEAEALYFERLVGPNPVFAGHYVAFALDDADVVCGKYDPSSPLCETHEVVSYNLKTGHARAKAAGAPAALVLTKRGWIGWVEGSAHNLLVVDSHGLHTLDPGPVDPRSLIVHGEIIDWSTNGVTHTAKLG
jgi:hypothetical protein